MLAFNVSLVPVSLDTDLQNSVDLLGLWVVRNEPLWIK